MKQPGIHCFYLYQFSLTTEGRKNKIKLSKDEKSFKNQVFFQNLAVLLRLI